jgi:uncharacterized damage-inducible protein DinB
MIQLADTVRESFANEYRARAAELHKWVEPLSDEQFWRHPYSYGNSVGHLVLHLTGNLSYYIGSQIAGSGYIRHRDLEFTESRKPPKSEVLGKFDEIIALVIGTIEKQSEAGWSLPYSAERDTTSNNRLDVFLRCASHLYHHLGQIIYLTRELQENRSQHV